MKSRTTEVKIFHQKDSTVNLNWKKIIGNLEDRSVEIVQTTTERNKHEENDQILREMWHTIGYASIMCKSSTKKEERDRLLGLKHIKLYYMYSIFANNNTKEVGGSKAVKR